MDIQEFKNLKFVLAILVLLFLVSLTGWVSVDILNKVKERRYIGQDVETRNTISVSGTGEIYAKPDLAMINFSVVTEKKTVAEAMSENTKKMNDVINSIKEQGVEEKDLKTIDFNIYPQYEWRKEICIPPCPEGKRVLKGYEVRQALEVKIRDMAKIGEIIQKATDIGANQAGELRFTIDKQDELKKQARQEAIEKAKARAKEISLQLGVKLVRIVNFNENGVVPVPYTPYFMETAAGLGGSKAPQIETGENKITVIVSITYEID